MCHAPCYNTEPGTAGIRIYVCVTAKNQHACCPSCLTLSLENDKYLHPCPTPTWELGSPSRQGVWHRGSLWVQNNTRERRQLRHKGHRPTFCSPSIRGRQKTETKLWSKICRKAKTRKVQEHLSSRTEDREGVRRPDVAEGGGPPLRSQF